MRLISLATVAYSHMEHRSYQHKYYYHIFKISYYEVSFLTVISIVIVIVSIDICSWSLEFTQGCTGKALATNVCAENTNTLNAGIPVIDTALTTSWASELPSTELTMMGALCVLFIQSFSNSDKHTSGLVLGCGGLHRFTSFCCSKKVTMLAICVDEIPSVEGTSPFDRCWSLTISNVKDSTSLSDKTRF